MAYTQITGNQWLDPDSRTYSEQGIATVPPTRVIAVMQAVKARNGSRINSFKYFVKEILDSISPSSVQRQKKGLTEIIQRVRDLQIGAHNYTTADFVFDVKRACAREGVIFDNGLFNSIVRKEA